MESVSSVRVGKNIKHGITAFSKISPMPVCSRTAEGIEESKSER